ncbi:hypothetical protein [Aurantimonas marianensis]|uniref:Uncharacterized protein n=1 Tax=Aurantimonas marianensis TaxID=2920428 RepID=A0A9X2KF12_9HYPH|nr:hypothetical protein [Aurantimonas marianensis]MCP3054986.1 hypothetical protein [Aurantimonas marianensis]
MIATQGQGTARPRPASLTHRHLDWIAALLIAAVGATLGVLTLRQAGYLFFYQNFTPEVVYAGCGLGFGHPGAVSDVLKEFILVRAREFDCQALGAAAAIGPPGLFARLQLYLAYAVGALWHPPRLTYAELWPLVAVATGAYAAGAFVLLRLFFPLVLALVGGGVLAASPVALSLVTSFRDYSKAPFFVWTLVFVILTMRAGSLRGALGWGMLAGLAIGIGVGFRGDVIILAPIGVLALLVAPGLRALARRGAGAAAMVAMMMLSAWPILSVTGSGAAGSLVLQGLSEPFRSYLAIEPAVYGLGDRYSDELSLSSIAAAERPLHPEWDNRESPPYYGVSQAMRYSGTNMVRWLPYFLGDLATQGLKSAAWITAFPVLVATDRTGLDPGGPVRNGPAASRYLAFFYDALGNVWLVPLAIAGLAVFFWREMAIRPNEALGVAVIFALVLAFPVVQFSVRHVFHLEFVWVTSILALFAAPSDGGGLKRVGRRFAAFAAGAVALVAITYGALLLYQQQALRGELEGLLAAPRAPVAADWRVETVEERRRGVFTVPVPPRHRDVVAARLDSMTDAMPTMGLQWDVRAAADRLVLTLQNCPAGDYVAQVGYATADNVWQPFDHDLRASVARGSKGSVTFLLPAFYRPTQHLATIAVDPLPQGCEATLERSEGRSVLPPLLTASLPTGWRDMWLLRGFGGFPTSP